MDTSIRPPLWLSMVLVFSAIWVGVDIVCGVTDALSGMFAASQTEVSVPNWPRR